MKKSIYKMIAVFLLFTMLITGCSIQNQNEAAAKKETTSTNTTKLSDPFTTRDLSGTVDKEKAISISLNNEKTSINQDGVSMVDGDLVISKEGTYILDGTLENGQVKVEADQTAKIQIVLNGVTITNQDGPAISIIQADKVFLTLEKDTKNTLSDGSKYDLENEEDEPNATIYSKADLTINGEGTLIVNGNYKHGIVSKDDLKIASGIIQVQAVADGIKGKDLVAIADGSITIESENDGIQASNTEKNKKGNIWISGGTITITTNGDGIVAVGILQIEDGDFNITTNGGSKNSSKTAEGNENPMWGKSTQGQQPTQGQQQPPQMPSGQKPQDPPTASKDDSSKDQTTNPGSENKDTTTVSDGISAKGLKAETQIYLLGGNIQLDTSDDSIHSGGNLLIQDGKLQIASGDDGIHADDKISIEGGKLTITKSYEGIEAADILVTKGIINVTSSDDGFNAAGGADGSSVNQRQGQNGFGNVEDVSIVIQGGTIIVNANGDGIDSNGTLLVSGGTTTVYGPVNDGNGPLDYGKDATVTGGSIIAGGSSGMAEGFTSSENQGSILTKLSSVVKANTEIIISDSAGKQVLTYTSPKDLSALIFSTSNIKKGETYTIQAGLVSLQVVAE